MQSSLADGGVERMDDLHIDTIDSRWRDRSTWVLSAINAYRSALQIRDQLQLPVKVALAFSLRRCTPDPFETVQQFESELDSSPPSLYLFEFNNNHSADSIVQSQPLPDEMVSALPVGSVSYLLKWKTEQGDDVCSVFIQG